MSRKFRIVEDEGSFFASWTLVFTESDGGDAYYELDKPQDVPKAIVEQWVMELKAVGRVTPVELRVALDLLLHYIKGG